VAGNDLKAYRDPKSLPGQKTFVEPDGVPGGGEPNSALPSPPWSRSKPIQHLHVPKPEGVIDKVRTPSKPGDQYEAPIPEVKTMPSRRPDMNASADVEGAMNGPPYPGAKKQKDQRGQARMYYNRWYRSHRGEIKRRAIKWWKKNKNKFNYKKDQSRRRKWPQKFERKPGGGVKENKDRTQKWRDQQTKAATTFDEWVAGPDVRFVGDGDPTFFVQPSTDRDGWVVGIDPDAGLVVVWFDQEDSLETVPVEEFFDDADFLTDEDADAVVRDFDEAFGWSDEGMAERVACRWAEMLYEKRPPDMDAETVWDRGRDRSEGWTDGAPAQEEDGGFVQDNPGSAKVIPENRDFVNNKAAARISDLLDGCDPSIVDRARGVLFRKTRTDERNRVFLFDVLGLKGEAYRVRVKILPPKGNVRNVAKADVLVSCSCPFFRWQGPEHWAASEGWLYGKPKGTAASPDVRDPDGKNRVCKHVAAVLDRMSDWAIPGGPTKVASVETVSWREAVVDEVVRRYGLQRRNGGRDADL